MPDLPHGWRVRNSDGEVRGPPPEDDIYFSGEEESGSEDGSVDSRRINIRPDSEGWEDLEDDSEALSIKCLLCDSVFPSAKVMVDHCSDKHDFDLLKTQREHKLDFYNAIKLVNYIRSEYQAGQEKPKTADPALWADDKYLQPALKEDALLFSLDDILDLPAAEEQVDGKPEE